MGDFVVARRFFRSFPISFPNRVTLVNLVELDMVYFNVILGMDKLHASFASIDCRRKVVKFQSPNEPILKVKEGNSILRG